MLFSCSLDTRHWHFWQSENNPFKRHVAQLASSESWGYLANVGPGEWQKSHHDYAQAPFFFDLPINPPQNAKRLTSAECRHQNVSSGMKCLALYQGFPSKLLQHGSDLLSSNCLNIKFNSYCFIFASPSNSEQSFTCHLCPRNLTVIVLLPALGRQSHRVATFTGGTTLSPTWRVWNGGIKFVKKDRSWMGECWFPQKPTKLFKGNNMDARQKCSWQIYEWYMNDLYHFIKSRKFEAKQKLIWYHTIVFHPGNMLLWWPI